MYKRASKVEVHGSRKTFQQQTPVRTHHSRAGRVGDTETQALAARQLLMAGKRQDQRERSRKKVEDVCTSYHPHAGYTSGESNTRIYATVLY